MHRVLLTGFGPFKEHTVNPSQSIAERLNGERIGGAAITGLTLPVAFGMDTDLVFPAIQDLDPCLVLSLGLNAGIDGIDLEMFAINHRFGGSERELIPIVSGAPAAYFATIDIDGIVRSASPQSSVQIRRHGYAGSYLCNHIFYQTLLHAAVHTHKYKVGFIHIPLATEHVQEGANNLPTRSLDAMTEAVRLIIEAALHTCACEPGTA